MIVVNSKKMVLHDNALQIKHSEDFFSSIPDVINFHNNIDVSRSQRECDFIIYLDNLHKYALETYKKYSANWFIFAKKCDFPFDEDTSFNVSELEEVIDPLNNTKTCLSLRVRMRDVENFGFNDWSEPFLINHEDIASVLFIDNARTFHKNTNDDVQNIIMDLYKDSGFLEPKVWVA